MMQIKLVFPYFFIIYLSIVVSGINAEFELNTPEHWTDTYPDCSGKKQSPIDIISSEAEDAGTIYAAHESIGLDAINMTLTNRGYTVQLTATFPSKPIGLLGSDKYTFEDLSFVWGTDSQDGSLHAIDGIKYDGEILMRFSRKEPEKSYLVVSYLLQVNDTIEDTSALSMLSTYFSKVKSVGSYTEIPEDRTFPFVALNLNVRNFFLYDGSAAWPPCDEIYLRAVKKEPIPVPSKVMEALREVELQDGAKTNARPIQFISEQNVRSYKKE